MKQFIFTVLFLTVFAFLTGCSDKKTDKTDADQLVETDAETDMDNESPDEKEPEPDKNATDNEVENDDATDDVTIDNETDDEADINDTDETTDESDNENPDDTDDDQIQNTNIIYVNEFTGGPEDGTSWQNAFMDLQPALDAATPGTQIWVAYGTYKPTSVHGLVKEEDFYDIDEFNRYKHFRMKDGVEIYGGFAGTETELDQRDIAAQETILSCDLGEVDEQNDNCFHIFYHPAGLDLDETAVLDGFSMMGGVADDSAPHDAGSVMYNDGSSPIVRNGWIYWNYSFKGAVFYNKDSSMKVTKTQFVNNEAPYSKGGVFYNENSDIEISECDIANSWAEGDTDSQGGAVYSLNGNTVITKTLFNKNKAGKGGAIFIESGNAQISDCSFEENQSEFGAGIHFNNSADSVISGCDFRYNETYGYGDSDGSGGAVRIIDSNVRIVDSIFFKQIAGMGGAVFSSATGSGTSSLTIINSAFSGNKMVNYGGALYIDKTTAKIANSVFFKNQYGSSYPGTMGGGIYKGTTGSLDTVNSIFKSNSAANGSHIYSTNSTSVTYSCVVQTDVYPGTGNINTEPLLISPEWDPLDFGLQEGSPCIDTGSGTPFENGGFAEDITHDLIGNDRIIKGKSETPAPVVDMGAVEYKP